MTRTWNRPLLIFTGAMAVAAVFAAVGRFADPRELFGVPIWDKPLKFAYSLGLYAATLAWMLSLVPRRHRWIERTVVVLVGTSVIEMGVIVAQTVRGTPSHFNVSTTLNAVLWAAMGAAIIGLSLAHLVTGVLVLRARIPDRVARNAIGIGLFVTLLGMLAAVPMVAGPFAGAHTVGAADGGPGLALTGWSTVAGDLRVGHFAGLHGMQVLPLLALLLNRLVADPASRVRLLRVAGAGYGMLTLLLTWQALRGQPLLRPDALTLAAAGLLTAGVTVAAVRALTRHRTPATGHEGFAVTGPGEPEDRQGSTQPPRKQRKGRRARQNQTRTTAATPATSRDKIAATSRGESAAAGRGETPTVSRDEMAAAGRGEAVATGRDERVGA